MHKNNSILHSALKERHSMTVESCQVSLLTQWSGGRQIFEANNGRRTTWINDVTGGQARCLRANSSGIYALLKIRPHLCSGVRLGAFHWWNFCLETTFKDTLSNTLIITFFSFFYLSLYGVVHSGLLERFRCPVCRELTFFVHCGLFWATGRLIKTWLLFWVDTSILFHRSFIAIKEIFTVYWTSSKAKS